MRILITGAGGASAISVWKSLGLEHEVYMGDIDPSAAGLYLVKASQRVILTRGDNPGFAKQMLELCKRRQIDVLISTVDSELAPLAKIANLFHESGIQLPLSPYAALMMCRDKYQLLKHCNTIKGVGEGGPEPQQVSLLTEASHLIAEAFPLFLKPRLGAGSRGILVAHDYSDMAHLPRDGSYIVQEYLPGDEYSVDVYIHSDGTPIAAVPRLRLKIDSGIAVASVTKQIPELSKMALAIASHVGIRYVANIQFKQALNGDYQLLEINPRFPGTLPLTTAAGVDIPKLLVADIKGEKLSGIMPFKSLMTVRYLTECYFDPSEWEALCQPTMVLN